MITLRADDKWSEIRQFLAYTDSDGGGLSSEDLKNGTTKLGVSDADTAVNEVLFVLLS
jgi:hypothetical protein